MNIYLYKIHAWKTSTCAHFYLFKFINYSIYKIYNKYISYTANKKNMLYHFFFFSLFFIIERFIEVKKNYKQI